LLLRSEQQVCKGEYTYGWYSTSGRETTIIYARLIQGIADMV